MSTPDHGGHPPRVRREDILAALLGALEPLPFMLALWEGGSTAFGRADHLSDLDLYALAEDGGVEEALAAAEQALEALSPITQRFRLPEPTWHGHAHAFYRLRDAPPHLLVDLVVLRRSVPERFLEGERHGVPVVAFDRTGEIAPAPLDRAAFPERVAARLASLRDSFPIFQALVGVEVARGDAMAALAAYHSYTLKPLLEVVRMRHCPERYDYGPKYSRADLPAEVVRRLERLWYVPDIESIVERQQEGRAWFAEVLDDLDRRRW